MGVITTGQTFASGDQVTSTKLNDIANQATFTSAADTTDNATLTVSGGKLKVKDNGIGSTQLATDAVEAINIKDGAVTSAKLEASAVSTLMPAGLVLPYAGGSAPSGYLVCDGSAVSRTTYLTLFTALGGAASPYGSGDGSTTFNLPDLRGRVIAGHDIAVGGTTADRLTGLTGGVNSDTVGNTGGEQTQTLSVAQMPAHTHDTEAGAGNPSPGYGTGSNVNVNLSVFDLVARQSILAKSTGGGGAHNNVQPTMILNYIIKT